MSYQGEKPIDRELLRGLSAYVPIRNGIEMDYPIREVVLSLLPVACEVIVSDGGSTDGTREMFFEWSERNPKVRVVDYPWPDPVDDRWFLLTWLNWTRENHCRYDMQLYTGADEVLCPKSHDVIRKAVETKTALWFSRLHFWRDHRHLVPPGTVCGDSAVRLGPTELWASDDEWHVDTPEPEIRRRAVIDPSCRFFHYGFIRHQEPFLKKSRVVQRAMFNTYDPRLEEAERTGKSWIDLSPFPETMPLREYAANDHPPFMEDWLKAHGFPVHPW